MPVNDVTNEEVDYVLSDSFTDEDWKEFVVSDFEQGATNISLMGSASTVSIEVPWDKSGSFIEYVLGYAVTDHDGKKLKRKIPAQHPYWPYMYARAITNMKGMKYDGTTEEYGATFRETTVWDRFTADIEFHIPPWVNTLPDDEVVSEDERFVSLGIGTKSDFLTISGGALKFAEGPPATDGPSGGPVSYPVDFPVFLSKWALVLHWWYVPVDFVLDSNGYPTKLAACHGRVNSATFWGNDAGTLLLENIVAEDMVPVPLTTTEFGRNKMIFPKISFYFSQFNPEKGVPGSSYRGHNLGFYRKTHKWYYYTNDSLTGSDSRPTYASVDMYSAFTYHGS